MCFFGISFLFKTTDGVNFLPSVSTQKITAILSFSCPVVLTNISLDPSVLIVVLVNTQKDWGFVYTICLSES
jgi:hypothetical protein